MGQGLFVVEYRAKVAHVEPAAACLTFPKMLGFRSKTGRQFACQIFPRRIVGVMRSNLVMLMRAIDEHAKPDHQIYSRSDNEYQADGAGNMSS